MVEALPGRVASSSVSSAMIALIALLAVIGGGGADLVAGMAEG
jgi:hypothetical protein